MAKEERSSAQEPAISIIGQGMTLAGDCQTEGTIRIEGRVEGTIRAGKSVVVGRSGEVVGDIYTQDAVISGKVSGSIVAESRLELQATCAVEGEIRSRRILLDEGGRFNGNIQMNDESAGRPAEVLSGRISGDRAESA